MKAAAARVTTLARQAAQRLQEQGWWLLVAALLIGGGLWAFAELADEVADGETRAFDHAVMLGLREAHDPSDPLGPTWLEEVARDITSLGGATVLVLLTLAAVGYLLMRRKWSTAIFIALSVIGGTLTSTALKATFARPRPDLVPHAVHVTSASFPSGHAMLTMVTFLTLGAVLAEVQPNRRFKVYILSWAVLLSLLVGVSRVYLGVHWPTDVIAGWCVGSAWALLCGTVALWMQRRGVIDAVPGPSTR
jgi:undecaprenyl-diphosphatase